MSIAFESLRAVESGAVTSCTVQRPDFLVQHIGNIVWISVQPAVRDMTAADFDVFEATYKRFVYGPYVRRLQHLCIVFDLSDIQTAWLLPRPALIDRMRGLLSDMQAFSRYFLVRSSILYAEDDQAMRLLQPFMDSDVHGTRLFTSDAEAAIKWCQDGLDGVGSAATLLPGRDPCPLPQDDDVLVQQPLPDAWRHTHGVDSDSE